MSRLIDLSDHKYIGQYVVVAEGIRIECRWPNTQRAQAPGKPLGSCLHWSATSRQVVHDDYGVNVITNPKNNEPVLVKMLKNTEKGAHLWGRNGYVLGRAIAGNPEARGQEPTIAQVELIAKYNAEEHAWLHIDPRAKATVPGLTCDAQATKIWATGSNIQVPTVFDHAGYAKLDGYGRWRYDCRWKLPNGQDLYAYYLAKTLEHYDALKAGKASFEFLDALKA